MNKYILSFILLTLTLYSNSQTIYVFDKSDLQPVAGVTIANSGKTHVAITNNKGAADISAFSETDSLYLRHVTFQGLAILKSDLAKSEYKVYMVDQVIKLNEVVFSANKFMEKKSDLPNKIDVIDARQIQFANPQSAGDLVQATGSVFVQQSQLGGSSPVLRGFEANRVLMVVDGVRMNNAIYRSGHLQNVITIDPQMLQRAEIVYGPGSVIYGSDAMGGVMHFYSKNPDFSSDGKLLVKGGAFVRYGSASNEKAGGVNVSLGWSKFASITSFSYKDIGDLRTGSVKNPFQSTSANDNFGKCVYYWERINNKDSMVTNSDPLVQKHSGYKQYDLLQKFVYKAGAKAKLIANFQFSNTGNVPRYDRLTDMSGGKLKYAEWYYGPQTRMLASLRAELDSSAWYDKLNLTLAYQNISEDRVQRSFGKSTREHREETVGVISLNADIMKRLSKENELRYGIEEVFNQVASKAYGENINTGVNSFNISSRYPDDGSTMNSVAAYASHAWELGKKYIFTQGVRISNVQLNAQWTDTMMKIMKFPFDKNLKQSSTAMNGHLGFVYNPSELTRFSFTASSGFRAPNVDDVSKVNDSKGTAYLLVVPNPDLKPEYSYNLELTASHVLFHRIQVEATGFYTLLKDAIVMRPATLNGSDSVMYGGYLCQVQSNKNAAEAYVTGCQASVLAQLNSYLSLYANLTYTYGRVSDSLPLDHVPPVLGLLSLKGELKKFKGEFYVRYNGDKLLKDYSPSGEDNLQYATPTGIQAWYTLNLKLAYQVNKYMQVQAGMENIMDVRYRVFASGISAPGRNMILALRANF